MNRPMQRLIRCLWPFLAGLWLSPAAAGPADPLLNPAARAAPGGPVELVPVPYPDLSRTEAVVRQALDEARRNLAGTVVLPDIGNRDLAKAYAETGAFYLAHQLYVAAESCYENARRLDPTDYRWPYYLGYRYQQDSKLDQAARDYRQALDLNPDYAPARLRLGQVLVDLNRPEEARPLLESVAGEPGLGEAALFALGRVAMNRHQPAKAAERFEQVLALDPNASQVHYPLAMAYRALGRVEDARAQLALRGEGEPRVTDPLVDELSRHLSGARTFYYRAIEAMRDGHFDVAVEAFREALKVEPDNVNARVTLARSLYLNGDAEGARKELDQALARDPRHALGLFLLGTLLEEQRDLEGAADYYRRAIEADPAQGGAQHFLANALMRGGRYADAAGHYAAAVAAVPEDTPALAMQAVALVQSGGGTMQARKLVEDALRNHPDDPLLTGVLARLLAAAPDPRVRDGQRALVLAQGLFARQPGLENAETLAMAQAETGDLELAAAQQRNAVDAVAAAGRFMDIERLQKNLDLYRSGKPCREPWGDFDPMLKPAPSGARGPFLEYPTRNAY